MATDKLYHLLAGFIISAVVTLVMGNHLIGLGVGLAAGVAKEVYDWRKNAAARQRGECPPHSVELNDFIFTGLGAGFGVLLILLLGYA